MRVQKRPDPWVVTVGTPFKFGAQARRSATEVNLENRDEQ